MVAIATVKKKASELGVPFSSLMAILEVECKSSGFNPDGSPVILYERHVMYKRLVANKGKNFADSCLVKYPDLVNTTPGGYGSYSEQHKKLDRAIAIDRASALESCSWGLGQVMGFQWKSLGYQNLQTFVNAMYSSEEEQLEAVVKFLRVNNLVPYLKNKQWGSLALYYNGSNYKINQYDTKLAKAELKWRDK